MNNVPPLDKETRRPRLGRTASVLFGVVAVSSSAGAATHYALCARDGSPACGNIGQLGRPLPAPSITIATPPPAIEQPAPVTTVTYNAPLVQITISTQLVAPPAARTVSPDPGDRLGPEFIEARPVVDAAGAPAPGNVMRKGGPR